MSDPFYFKTDADFFANHWRTSTYAGYLIGQGAIRQMLEQDEDEHFGRGTLIFTGASASLRGKAKFSAFASAKSGLRTMAQSIAREFGPQGSGDGQPNTGEKQQQVVRG